MLQAPTTATDYSVIYVGQPDIPAGITISAYREARPRPIPWWRARFSGRSQRRRAIIGM